MTALEFLKRAADGKHRIVSSGDLHVMQISEAQANKLFFVDDQTGLGWALVPWELTTAKDRHREAGFFTRGGSGWNTQLHNEACDSEIAEQRKRLASRAALTECAEDLDQHTPADMQTTTGSTIAWLMHRCYAAEMEVQRFKDAKNPLFERGVCGELLAACKLSLDACQKNLAMAEYKDEPSLLEAFRACRVAIEKANHFRDAKEMVESK